MNEGERFGRYQIVRIIGRGAMGEVYLAEDTVSGGRVAVKIVAKGPEDEDMIAAEQLGAELQKRLAPMDQRVVAVNRYGVLSGSLFIEMEYIEGDDLLSLVRKGPLDARRAAEIASELCEMLENLQGFVTNIDGREISGVVHGDLKPGNVRINSKGGVKVLDFGIARELSRTRRHATSRFSTTAYCSPERLDTDNMDLQSDLWSVGVLLYEMVVGELPFKGQGDRLRRRILAPDPPEQPRCPAPLRDIIMNMLDRSVSRRYQTATEAKQDLLSYLKGGPVRQWVYESDVTKRTTTSFPETLGDDDLTRRTISGSPVPPVTFDPGLPRRRNPLVRLVLFGVLCAVVVVLGLSQVNYWTAAEAFKSELETERGNLADAWTRYQQLEARFHIPFLLSGAKRPLRARLLSGADQIIGEYRDNDSPSVREKQWNEAKAYLQHAMELERGDNSVLGKFRLCEGHLERITAEHTAARTSPRQKHLNAAVSKFQEAAILLKSSSDPYLGLAHLYVYDLMDVDKAEDAINKAVEYHHPKGKREIAELADGYALRADHNRQAARGFKEHPAEERSYLEKAREDYVRAEELYKSVGDFSYAIRNYKQVARNLESVVKRLAALEGQ